jgi:hypothetical protein
MLSHLIHVYFLLSFVLGSGFTSSAAQFLFSNKLTNIGINNMNDQNYQAFIMQLLDRVMKADKTEFHLIRSWYQCIQVVKDRIVLRLIIKSFKRSIKNLTKSYSAEVISGDSHVEKILAINSLKKAYKFYENELQVINAMIEEWLVYVSCFHFFESLFRIRDEEDLWDHRGLYYDDYE